MPENAVSYHVCPQCARAVPAQAGEQFCPNDGTALLKTCPGCSAPILSPYSQFCTRCARPYAGSLHSTGGWGRRG
ncbi:double zinc ribbon domain-containing protein [Deinococcus malanensis]|uniref:double zinc ribbon domain-containing protein n=1 Tax=Deinococcus malanensis TaxID=1706855 RepID=UPI00166B3261